MRDKKCPVCGGRRLITLPLMQEVSVSFDANAAASMSDTAEYARDYPCPECSPKTSIEHVNEVGGTTTVDERMITEPRALEYLRHGIARSIADELLKGGWIDFSEPEKCEDTAFFGRSRITGRVGVVSISVIKSLDQRISERQFAVADDLAAAASAQISNWGSSYSGNEGSIHKSTAIDFVYSALHSLRERRANKKAKEAAK